MRLRGISAYLLVLLVLAGCGDAPNAAQTPAPGSSPAAGGSLTVFAAASLQDALKEIDAQVEETVTSNFAGSQVLVTQLREGARADLLITADKESMDAAIENGTVEAGSEQVVATNRLVVATAPGSSAVASLGDLAKSGVKLVLAEESVPAGRYSLQVLDKLSADPAYGAGFKESVLANVVSRETNVRQTLAKVSLGEADAGIVYATDARLDGKVGTVAIPEAANVLARYYGAPVKDAANRQAAYLFLGYLLSEDGQSTLAKYGFGRAESK
jgi:molybdate transport system substrate-binding protein